MANKEAITESEAKKWIASGEWANGWTVKPDESIDAVEFFTQYHKNKTLWDKLFAFLAKTDPNTLEPGKIVLEDGKLWINVLEYTPKDSANTKIEAHRNFIDLQYTYQGNEIMGVAKGEVTPTNDYDPVKDKQNFSTKEEIEYVPASADLFFLYFPKDMHQPSVKSIDVPGVSRKIVGKIEYAK